VIDEISIVWEEVATASFEVLLGIEME